MVGILIATLVLAISGILVGIGLVFAGKKFHVDVDEREVAVREVLPGNNCGACGYAGCDAMAAAIAKGEAPVNGCPVGGQPVADAVGEIMGVSAEAGVPNVAFVRCDGSCGHTKQSANYVGITDCRSAVLSGISNWECDYGCCGLGSCAAVCPQGAIKIVDGVAVVDRKKCIGCGLCVKACPKHIIELMPANRTTAVRCANQDKGPAVKKTCSVGCIGCTLCTKQCKMDAIHMEGNVAHIDYTKCVDCKACAKKCPAKCITMEL